MWNRTAYDERLAPYYGVFVPHYRLLDLAAFLVLLSCLITIPKMHCVMEN